ncbi:MAG: hypothetical protein Q9223_007097 [Gallowayella weberi]
MSLHVSAHPEEHSPRVQSTSHSSLHVDKDDILQDLYTTYWNASPEWNSKLFEDRDDLLGADNTTSDYSNQDFYVGSNPLETNHATAPAQPPQQDRDATTTSKLKHLAARAELLAAREERLAIKEERLAVKEERLAVKEERLALLEEVERLIKTRVNFDQDFMPPTSTQYPIIRAWIKSAETVPISLWDRVPPYVTPRHPASSSRAASHKLMVPKSYVSQAGKVATEYPCNH